MNISQIYKFFDLKIEVNCKKDIYYSKYELFFSNYSKYRDAKMQ